MRYRENITITVGFISLIFVPLIILFIQKKNLVVILLYQAQASEPQVDLRYQPIVVSEVGLYLEVDRYSCD